MEQVLGEAVERAFTYLTGIDERPVRPETIDVAGIGGPLPEDPTDPILVVKLLDEVVDPANMAMTGPRFFGWVISGSHPVALAADWMVSAWDPMRLRARWHWRRRLCVG